MTKLHRLMAAACLACATLAQAQTPAPTANPAKKELVQKILQLQQPELGLMAQNLAQEPAALMMQQASQVLQTQVPPEKRDALAKDIQAQVKKYMDESVPMLRDRAVKLAPSTVGAALEDKFTEDELKQLVAWFESPVNKKFIQAFPAVRNDFVQKLVADARPAMDPKLQALEAGIRTTLSNGTAPAAGKPAAPKPPARPASKP
jgi:hypothetical protein